MFVKPQSPLINYGNPLTKGLVFAMPVFSKGGTQVLDVRSKILTAITNQLSTAWSRQRIGSMLSFDGAATNGQYVNAPLLSDARSNHQRTYCLFFIRSGNGSGSSTNSYFRENDTATAGFTIVDNSSIPALQINFGSWSTTNGQWVYATPANNVLNFLVVTYDDTSVSNVPGYWLNGVKQVSTSATQPVGSLTYKDTNICLGNAFQTANVGTRTMNGFLSDLCKWNRILTDAEVRALSVNPYQIYKTPVVLP